MNILRVAFPGSKLMQWIPSWDRGQSSQRPSVRCMEFAEDRKDDWLNDVKRYVANYPDTVIQYEGRRYVKPVLPTETAGIRVVQHLAAIPRKTAFSHIVVPSFYARDILRRKGYRAVTIQPAVELVPDGAKSKSPSKSALTVLLYPGTTTTRVLQSIRMLRGNRWGIDWLLIDDGSQRVHTIERTINRMKQPVRIAKSEDIGDWQQADVMVSDQHPAYSLNALHLRVMAHGIPILTTTVGDHPELVKHWHNGFLLEPRQLTDDLKYYFKQLIRNRDLLEQLSVNGRYLCHKFHSNRLVSQDWLRLYRLVGQEKVR